jgi:hypothetical protein
MFEPLKNLLQHYLLILWDVNLMKTENASKPKYVGSGFMKIEMAV